MGKCGAQNLQSTSLKSETIDKVNESVMFFRGIKHLNLDAKGRLAIPSGYQTFIREQAQGQVVLTVDADGCLLIYPLPEWERVEQSLMALPNMNRRVRNLQRLILGHAAERDLDKQGRILVPAPLREFAHLKRQVVLVGQANKFELWDANIWVTQREQWLAEARDSDDDDDVLAHIAM